MGNALIKSLISYLIISTIFITGSDMEILGAPVYWYYPVHILFAFFCVVSYRTINVKISAVLALASAYVWVVSVQGESLVIKQLVNILFSSLVFYNLIVHENFDLEAIIKKYVVFCKWILVIGFIQVLFFALGSGETFLAIFPFLKTTNITLRFQSITAEPSFIAFTFAPVVFISLCKIFYNTTDVVSKKWAYGFLLGYWLTFSLTAYIGVLVMLVILGFKNLTIGRVIVAFTIVVGAIFIFSLVAYKNVSYIKERVDDTYYGVTHPFTDSTTFMKVNLSTYAFLSNAYVAGKSLENRPLTGYGLGTHELTYDRFLPKSIQSYSSLNRTDANSMALRLITETGLIGLSLFVYFIFRFKIVSKKSFTPTMQLLWMLNSGIFVMILIALLRNGNYTVHGKIFFLFLYYYSWQVVRELRASRELAEERPGSEMQSPSFL
jgi:hypothetical protein